MEFLSILNNIKAVDHRLHISRVNGKVILDDSFNGNLEGMLEAVKISSTHDGRKVIITPGIVESTDEANIELAKAIDDVFDIAIITGDINQQILVNNIKKAQVVILKDKSDMEVCLLENTKFGDLILFANDAPNFI